MNRVALAVGLTALLGLFAADASAQFVSGKVVDQDGQPTADAVITFSLPSGEARAVTGKTNNKGDFTLAMPQIKGPWMLSVTKQGFAEYKYPEEIYVSFGGSPKNVGTIKLAPQQAGGVVMEAAAHAALQAQFKQGVQVTQEADAAADAGDSATAAAKYDQAIAVYKEMIAKLPDIPETHHNLAYVYGRKKAWAESADEYVKAAKLTPQMLNDYLMASVALQNSGQRAKAIEVLNEAVKDNPTNARLVAALGECCYNGAQYADASAAFKKAQELDPASAEPLYYLGMIAVSQGRTQECISLLEKYLALNPTNATNVQAAKGVLGALKPAKK